MKEKDCPMSPQEVSKQLDKALKAGADVVDPNGGYHPRKGYKSQPPAVSDPNGITVWAIDQYKKVN